MIISKHFFLPLTTALILSIARGSSAEYVDHLLHQSSCSSQSQQAVLREDSLSNNSNATEVSHPHKYFPAQIRRIVDAADAISPNAIEPPDTHPYPVIDISSWMNPFASSEEDKQHVVNQVLEEAKTNGSFNIVGHGIEDTLFDRLYSSAKNFFSLSVEHKKQYSFGNNRAGYVANRNESLAAIHGTGTSKEQKDLRESFSMSYPPSFVGNVQGPEDFHGAMAEYIEQLQSVQKSLKEIFTASLGSAKEIDLPTTYLHDLEPDATGLLRAARYPSIPGFDDATKLLPHSDFGTITIIASEEEGLEEVRDGRWYKVPMSKGELHVNIGQMYSMWSNELFRHNVHRVSKEAKEDRISFSYFTSQGQRSSDDSVDVGVSPICSDGEVAKFPRVSTIDHIMHYMNAFITGRNDE